MSTRICPVCGADYLDWVSTCSVCGVQLVTPGEAPDPLRLPVEQQVVYELGVWPLGLQAAAAQAMAESGIPHGWDRTDLVVHLDHEATVDDLLDAIEQEQPDLVDATWSDERAEEDAPELATVGAPTVPDARGAGGGDDAGPDDDVEAPEGVELEYELDEWPDADREELGRRLAEDGIDHRWEDGTVLVVPAAHEDVVEAHLDELEFPDALAAEAVDEGDETSFELMSELFVAADRLKRNPRDPDGIEGLATVVEAGDPDRPPYGVEPVLWRQAIELANDLADRLAGAGDGDGDGYLDGEVDEDGEPRLASDDLMGRATVLRNLLRPFV